MFSHGDMRERKIKLQLSEFSAFLVVFSHLVLLSSRLCLADPPPDPGHRGGNGPGRPEGDALGEGRSSSVVSDEDCRVSGGGVLVSSSFTHLEGKHKKTRRITSHVQLPRILCKLRLIWHHPSLNIFSLYLKCFLVVTLAAILTCF